MQPTTEGPRTSAARQQRPQRRSRRQAGRQASPVPAHRVAWSAPLTDAPPPYTERALLSTCTGAADGIVAASAISTRHAAASGIAWPPRTRPRR